MPLHKVNDGTSFELNYEIIPNVLPADTVFIHGNCASNRWWYPTEEVLKRQSKGQNLTGAMILAEFRGCGKSTAPQTEAEVNMHTFANDFISLVKSLHRGPVHLVGHSTGGLIAALMLAKEPTLFKKAVLLDPVGATGVKFDNSMIAAFEQMKADKELTAVVLGSTIYKNNPQSDFFRSVVVEDAFHAVKTVGHWVLKALDGLDVKKELASIHNEVLVLHGEHDQLLPMADSKALADLLPKGEFKLIPDHGHCTNIEDSAQFVSIFEKFLY